MKVAAAIAANRFGLGAQPGDLKRIDKNPRAPAMRVVADWPGLRNSDLYQGRDLKPTADVRSLFKGVLSDHLSIPDALLEHTVFPDSAAAKPMRDLILS